MRKKKTWFRCFVCGENKTIPTVFVVRVGEQFTFFCYYCKRDHWHGAREGHRVAHCCSESSPYYKTGYFLKEEK